MFLGIDVQLYKANDIWFDVVNLLLLTLYFFKFGNQSAILRESKVSFSKTSRLEKILKEYTRMQQENKDALVERVINENADQNKKKGQDKEEPHNAITDRKE